MEGLIHGGAYFRNFMVFYCLTVLHVLSIFQGLSTQDYSENLYFHHCQMSEAFFKTLTWVDCLIQQIEVGSGVQVENSF